jgi:hypothetical protein
MHYQPKADRDAAFYMTWSELLAYVKTEQRDEREARRQIGHAIAEGRLPVRWIDQRMGFGASSPNQTQADEPPRDAQYWQECETNPKDPDLVLEPPPYDRELVGKRTAARLDKKRRWRKPIFQKEQVFKLWQLLPPSGPSDPTRAGAGSDTVVSLDSRRRGPKPDVGNKIKESMRTDLREKQVTCQQLSQMKEEAMVARYGGSRDTCRKARNTVLSEPEFLENGPPAEIPTNSDK